jgi:hypothetical protein
MSASMGFHADRDTRITTHVYGPGTPPILALDGPDHALTIAVFATCDTADHVAFAHQLTEAVTRYAAAVDAYAAAHTPATPQPR